MLLWSNGRRMRNDEGRRRQLPIRTRRGTVVQSYDTLERAKDEQARHEARIGVPLLIIKVTVILEEIPTLS